MPNRAAPLTWNRQKSVGAPERHAAESSRKLSRQAIIVAAFRVADAEGLDAVTMRRLAAELGVRPTTLYGHIAAKADLLELMANELVGLTLVDKPLPADWRDALSQLSKRLHTTLIAHPWALRVFARSPRMGPNSILRAKQLARAVADLKLEPTDVWALLAIVDDYVIGNALRVATGANERSVDDALSPGDLVEFPELAALPRAQLTRSHIDRFEAGLKAVLDGVASRFLPQGQGASTRRPAARSRARASGDDA